MHYGNWRTNSYFMNWHTSTSIEILLDLSTLNSWIWLPPVGTETSQQDFKWLEQTHSWRRRKPKTATKKIEGISLWKNNQWVRRTISWCHYTKTVYNSERSKAVCYMLHELPD
jgi:hypothetical protein